MLDSHASQTAPALIPPPAASPQLPRPNEPLASATALLRTAHALLPRLEAGQALDAPALRSAMTSSFGAGDADGAWSWKDAYEAAEAALVLFLQRYGRAMRRQAGTSPDASATMLAMLRKIAALEPSQTRRSEDQLRLQQFSTPLPLAYAALQAAAIRPGDVVLEPSAGTGMLAVMAQCALGTQSPDSLHLNEIAAVRSQLLASLFPAARVTTHNAESLADRLPSLRPTVILMNPPFSASPGIERTRRHADLKHIRSAASMLPPGGRLVTISSSACSPASTAWKEAFASLDPPAVPVFNLLARPVFDPDGRAVLCQEALERRDALIQKLAALPPVTSALDQIMRHFGHDAVAEVTGRSRRVLRITDAKGERLALRSRPASANLAETAAFMDGTKRILVFSMAGGTGRSYHADLGCGNTERRIHYLLEPGWRADQAIQGLGRTHRTHQASAPLFRPVATDVKGERRFIATIARRLDSLGAITRGQRDSQIAMGGDDTALFRESDNLESPYARAALRQFYLALHAGRIDGWSLHDFQEATGLKLTHEGGLKEDLPPMSQFLNRLLALPIDEQNTLFAALETRIEANIAAAVEAGSFNLGVENVRSDSLTIVERETIFVHPTTGAETEIAEIVKRDRLQPLSADDALAIHRRSSDKTPELVVNAQSNRAGLVMPAPSRMLDDGGVETRFRLLRPRDPETIASKALAASNWTPADEPAWRHLWDTEIASLPSHTETRFWLVAGLLLPIWDRLPETSLRVRRLTADDGQQLIGRTLRASEVRDVRAAFGLDGGPALSAEELRDEIMTRGATVRLTNGWRIARRRHMGGERVEIDGPVDCDLPALKRAGCVTEIVSWHTRVFAPTTAALQQVIEHWPVADAA